MKIILTLLLIISILTVSAQTRYSGLTPNDHKLLVNDSLYDGHGIIPTCSCLKKKNGEWYLRNDTNPYSGNCVVLINDKVIDSMVFFSRKKDRTKIGIQYYKGFHSDYDYHVKRVQNGDTVMIPCDTGDFKIISNYLKGKRHGYRLYYENGTLKKREEYWNGELTFFTFFFLDFTIFPLDSLDQQRANFNMGQWAQLKNKKNSIEPSDSSEIELLTFINSYINPIDYEIPYCACLNNKEGAWYDTNSNTPFEGHCAILDQDFKDQQLLLHEYSSSYNKFQYVLRSWHQTSASTARLKGMAYIGKDPLGFDIVHGSPELPKEKINVISSYRNGQRHGERIYYKDGEVERIELYYFGQLFSETIFVDSSWAKHPLSY